MGFGENILRKVAGAFSHQASEQLASNDAVFEVTPVNPEDIKKRGHWKNAEGKTLRINLEKGTMSDYANKEELVVDLVNTKAIQEKLEKGGYVFVPATGEVVVQEHKEVESLTDQPLPEMTDVEVEALVKNDEALEQSLEGMSARVELINVALTEAQAIVDRGHFPAMQSIIDEIAERVTAVVETVNELSEVDDLVNEVLAVQDGKLSEGDVAAKQARLEKLKALSEEIELLEQHALTTIRSLKKLDNQAIDIEATDTVMAAGSKNRDVQDSVSGTVSAGEKKRFPRKKNRGGSNGGDGTGEDDEPAQPRGTRGVVERATLLEAKRNGDTPSLPDDKPDDNPDATVQSQTIASQPEPQSTESTHEQRQKALREFLQRPEGQEIVDTYRMVIAGEWEKFTQTLGRSKKVIPHDKAVDIWEQDVRFLPRIRTRLETDLVEKHGMDQVQAHDIFLDILEGLDKEYLRPSSGSETF